MRTTLGFPAHLVFLSLLLVSGAFAGAPAERFPWLTNLDEARELAAGEGKPLLIVFRCEP